jgi:hypothetical protein
MSKTLNQIIFFSSTKIRIFFSPILGIRICFRKKPYPPPLQMKWSFPYLSRKKNNLILYSIFDHLTFGGWGIFLFVKKKASNLIYHPFSTVTWCLLQKCYHCVCLSASDTGRIQIVGSIYLFFIAGCIKTYQPHWAYKWHVINICYCIFVFVKHMLCLNNYICEYSCPSWAHNW